MRGDKWKPWSDEETARLFALVEGGARPEAAARELSGRTAAACKQHYNITRRQRAAQALASVSDAVIPASEPPKDQRAPIVRRPWSERDVARLRAMRKAGQTFRTIDAALGRSTGASEQKFHQLDVRETLDAVAHERPARATTAVLADRAARAGLDHPTITAAVFGDPLPGRSALDRMRTAQPAKGPDHASHH